MNMTQRAECAVDGITEYVSPASAQRNLMHTKRAELNPALANPHKSPLSSQEHQWPPVTQGGQVDDDTRAGWHLVEPPTPKVRYRVQGKAPTARCTRPDSTPIKIHPNHNQTNWFTTFQLVAEPNT
jgi:hypothetical protein